VEGRNERECQDPKDTTAVFPNRVRYRNQKTLRPSQHNFEGSKIWLCRRCHINWRKEVYYYNTRHDRTFAGICNSKGHSLLMLCITLGTKENEAAREA
jgi:ribosomal protein L37AE/L43A